MRFLFFLINKISYYDQNSFGSINYVKQIPGNDSECFVKYGCNFGSSIQTWRYIFIVRLSYFINRVLCNKNIHINVEIYKKGNFTYNCAKYSNIYLFGKCTMNIHFLTILFYGTLHSSKKLKWMLSSNLISNLMLNSFGHLSSIFI